MLILAAEDYTGPTPADADGQPNYLAGYEQALLDGERASRPACTTWTRWAAEAPDPLGVLAHFDAVIWYTGDDYLTREPGQVPGTGTSRLALDEVVAVRDYLNEGGKVFLGGKHAGQQFFEGYEFRNEGFPQPDEDKKGEWCDADAGRGEGRMHRAHQRLLPVLPRRVPARGGRRVVGRRDGRRAPRRGDRRRSPARGRRATRAADPSAGAATSTLASTSSLLDTPAYDDFSEVVANWDRLEAGPVHAARREPVPVLGRRRPGVQAPVDADRGAGRRRDADVLDLVRHRAGLGLLLRRGGPRRDGRVDHAARGRRAHVRQRRRVLPRRHGLGRGPAPAAPQLPDATAAPRAIRRARPARGTRPPARPAAGRSGRST